MKNDIVISLAKYFDSTLITEAKAEFYCNAIAKIYECGMCSPSTLLWSVAADLPVLPDSLLMDCFQSNIKKQESNRNDPIPVSYIKLI